MQVIVPVIDSYASTPSVFGSCASFVRRSIPGIDRCFIISNENVRRCYASRVAANSLVASTASLRNRGCSFVRSTVLQNLYDLTEPSRPPVDYAGILFPRCFYLGRLANYRSRYARLARGPRRYYPVHANANAIKSICLLLSSLSLLFRTLYYFSFLVAGRIRVATPSIKLAQVRLPVGC